MNYKSSVYFKTFSLILIMVMVLGCIFSSDLSAAKKAKEKKAWYPMSLTKFDLTDDQKAKLDKLSSYKKLSEIRDGLAKKGIKHTSADAKQIKKEKGWNDLTKEFKKDIDKILTDAQKKELKKIQEAWKKKK